MRKRDEDHVGKIFMNASPRKCLRPTNMTVMRADQNPNHAQQHSHGNGAPNFSARGTDVASLQHDCDFNCLYCWGPETD